jgi:hypothetical protein
MPHTRPTNLVCLPHLSQLESISTLIHELWHIHQRTFQERWAVIFRQLRWTPWNGSLPPSLEKGRRYNPDTIDQPLWVFQQTWVSFPIFRDLSKPVVSEVDIWFYHIHDQYHVKHVPFELETYFPSMPPSAYEHPRELTAYLLADADSYRHSPALTDLLQMIGQISIIPS